jgi:hypothetical protein
LYFAAADCAGGLKALLSTSKWGAARLFVRLFIAALLYVLEVLEDVGRFLFEARDGPDWSWRDSNSSSSFMYWFYEEKCSILGF